MKRKVTVVVREAEDPSEDRRYWAAKSPAERVAAVGDLRARCFAFMGTDGPPRMRRDVVRVLSTHER